MTSLWHRVVNKKKKCSICAYQREDQPSNVWFRETGNNDTVVNPSWSIFPTVQTEIIANAGDISLFYHLIQQIFGIDFVEEIEESIMDIYITQLIQQSSKCFQYSFSSKFRPGSRFFILLFKEDDRNTFKSLRNPCKGRKFSNENDFETHLGFTNYSQHEAVVMLINLRNSHLFTKQRIKTLRIPSHMYYMREDELFHPLPMECWIEVFSHLDCDTLRTVFLICKKWNSWIKWSQSLFFKMQCISNKEVLKKMKRIKADVYCELDVAGMAVSSFNLIP